MSRSLLVFLLHCPAAFAGLYNLAEPLPFKVSPDGFAEELSYYADGSGAFPLDFAIAGNYGDDRPRKNPDRQKLLDRVNGVSDSASRGADLIRLRKYEDAVNLLAPKRDDWRCAANLAHNFAMQADWRQAIRYRDGLTDDPQFLSTYEPPQRAWLRRVEQFYDRWLTLREEEAATRLSPAQETVLPLFGTGPPKDAIAIVQQLLLWDPDDQRLYWLLGELYANSGRYHQAKRIYDSLASEDRRQSNRRKLMERRTEIHRLAATLPPPVVPEGIEVPDPPKNDRPWNEQLGLSETQLVFAGSVFAVLAVLLFLFQMRRLIRRRR